MFPSLWDTVWCSTLGYILDSTRLSGRVFVETDITKYGPLEEIKCSYQEAWWSLPSETNLLLLSCALEPSEILFAMLFFIFHAFPFCITSLPRKLTVVSPFSPPPPFFSPFLFSSHSTSSLLEWKYISTGYTLCSSPLSLDTPYLCCDFLHAPLQILFLCHFLS